MREEEYSEITEEMIRQQHSHSVAAGQCGSRVMQAVEAPAAVVWSLVRDFRRPHAYKRLVRSCVVQSGDGGVGSVREVRVVSGMPAGLSVERLDRLDDANRVMSFSIVGGDHRLQNYRSTTTVHEEEDPPLLRTVVIESYVVDVPPGSTAEDTCAFADTIIRCNLMSLAKVAEKLSAADHSAHH